MFIKPPPKGPVVLADSFEDVSTTAVVDTPTSTDTADLPPRY
jgi:hypothetical protein